MQWLSNKITKHQTIKNNKKQEELERMSCQAINVTEFNGKLYIAHNNVPIVPVENLNAEVEKVVAASRKSYLTWRTKYNIKYE